MYEQEISLRIWGCHCHTLSYTIIVSLGVYSIDWRAFPRSSVGTTRLDHLTRRLHASFGHRNNTRTSWAQTVWNESYTAGRLYPCWHVVAPSIRRSGTAIWLPWQRVTANQFYWRILGTDGPACCDWPYLELASDSGVSEIVYETKSGTAERLKEGNYHETSQLAPFKHGHVTAARLASNNCYFNKP